MMKYIDVTEADNRAANDALAALDSETSSLVQCFARHRIQSTERMSNTILAMLGNVSHDTPGGSNAAAMRGGMLEDIRKYLTSPGKTNDPRS